MKRVTKKQARLLAKLGYNIPCGYYYDTVYPDRIQLADGSYHYNNEEHWADKRSKSYSAPYIADVLKWIREEKGILGLVTYNSTTGKSSYQYGYIIVDTIIVKDTNKEQYNPISKSYEEAESALLDELINILNNTISYEKM